MSFPRPIVYDRGFQRKLAPGDAAVAAPISTVLTTVGNGTILASLLDTTHLRRSGPTGAFTDTLPTAEAIGTLVRDMPDSADHIAGLGFVVRYINTTGFAATLAVPANEGISFVSTLYSSTPTAVAASKYRDLFFELASAPIATQLVMGSTSNGTKRIALATELKAGAVVTGMSVYGTGIGVGARVTNVVYGVSGIKEVWVDTNSTADGAMTAITCKPTILVHSFGAGDI